MKTRTMVSLNKEKVIQEKKKGSLIEAIAVTGLENPSSRHEELTKKLYNLQKEREKNAVCYLLLITENL